MNKKVIKQVNPAKSGTKPVFNIPLRTKYILLAIVGFVFYANSLPDKYALDDNFIILKNAYVQMGFSGIPKILTHDSYTSFYMGSGGDPSGLLSAGRFRPLSQIIFAIEQPLFGNSATLPYFRHLVNIAAYMACILLIFYFLDKFLLKKIPGGSDIAFLAAFLFAIHPLHTEVVANIKSFDEILSLSFMMLTFIFSLIYLQSKKVKHLIIGSLSYFLALFSKEYAVTLVFFIPFLFYLLEGKRPASAIIAGIPYYGVAAIYMLMRYNAVGFHTSFERSTLLSNPYYYATHAQKIATEWFVLGKYLVLLFFPYPLSSDYSYNQIPYHNFSDITVLISILIYVVIFYWGIMLTRQRNVLSFAVFFFLINILMISNFVLDIGATMGERLVFHSSLGWVIIVAYYLNILVAGERIFGTNKTLKTKKNILIGIMTVIGMACFGETINRNSQWKDDTTLFIHDVKVAPNSFLVNNNAGSGYLGFAQEKGNTEDQINAYLDSAHKYLIRALHFNSKYTNAYLNLGGVYLQQGLPDSTKYCLDMVKELHPDNPVLKSHYALLSQYYLDKGFEFGRSGKLANCINYMEKALPFDSTNSDIWYNLGVAFYQIQEYDSAQYAWVKTLQYQSDSTDVSNAKRGLQQLSQMRQQ
jgi:protein O-mannosyl-transferase